MIHFPVLRTRRLMVQLRELSIGESIAIAAMPTHLQEASCTAFLRHAVVANTDVATTKNLNDPADWTVQERMMAVCHYLAAVSDDGPDFSVGDHGHYSDYLDGSSDAHAPALTEPIKVGEVGGDAWYVQHLTGAMAESIERLVGEINGISGRLHWLMGGMAAQMVRKDEDAPDATDSTFDQFLIERMRVMASFPESDFASLLNEYMVGREKLYHLFRVEFSDNGLVALPKGGTASNLPSARFPVSSCLSGVARNLVAKSDKHGIKS